MARGRGRPPRRRAAARAREHPEGPAAAPGMRRPKPRPVSGGISTRRPRGRSIRCGPSGFPARPSGGIAVIEASARESLRREDRERRVLAATEWTIRRRGGARRARRTAFSTRSAPARRSARNSSRRQLVGAPVQVAVQGDLVPPPRRLAHEIGVTRRRSSRGRRPSRGGRPGRAGRGAGEGPLEPRREGVPPPRVGVVVVAADVEPLLRVDREDARRAAGRAQRRERRRRVMERGFSAPRRFSPSRTPCSTRLPRK